MNQARVVTLSIYSMLTYISLIECILIPYVNLFVVLAYWESYNRKIWTNFCPKKKFQINFIVRPKHMCVLGLLHKIL